MSKTSETIVRKAAAPKRSREQARAIAQKALAAMTDAESDRIEAAALADPDAQPRRRPGRPLSATKKIAVSLKLDPDLVAAYRRSGAGWQTRMNDDLRKAAGLDT